MLGNLFNQVKGKIGGSNVYGDSRPFYINGVRMLEAGNYSAALRDFKQAAAVNPKQAFTFFHLGNAYFNLNRFSEAKKSYEKFLELYADLDAEEPFEIDSHLDINTVHADVYNNLGVICDIEQNFVKAIGFYQRAIRAERDRVEIINNLGNTYFKMGLYHEAIKAFEQALKIDSDNSAAHYGLGLVYIDLKDKNEILRKVQILESLNRVMATELQDKFYQCQHLSYSKF